MVALPLICLCSLYFSSIF